MDSGWEAKLDRGATIEKPDIKAIAITAAILVRNENLLAVLVRAAIVRRLARSCKRDRACHPERSEGSRQSVLNYEKLP